MEAIAIIGCVAAVVSAYRDGGAIVDRIKQKRSGRKAPPPPRLLEDSLARGPKAVEEAKETGVERFGEKYADKVALDSLKDILIDLQGSLLKHLRQAQDDDNMTDFTTLVDASDIGRIRTVTVLNELYIRVAMGTTVRHTSFGDMGSFTSQQIAHQDSPVAPNVVSQFVISPPSSPSNGMVIQQPNSAKTETSEQPNGQRTTARAGFFDKFRRRSSSDENSVTTSGRPLSDIRSKRDAARHGDGQDKVLPLSPMTLPQAAIDEDNPWATEDTRNTIMDRVLPPDNSFSRAATLVPRPRQRPSMASSASSTPSVKMPSPHELPGGFCKGAHRMQVQEKNAMKLRTRSVGKTGGGHYLACLGEDRYWACCSFQCAFEGPARQVGKNWAFDDTVREGHGVRYRWSFLAKAHVASRENKNNKYDYRCVFCIYDGYECPIFHGIRDFIAHVGDHRGKAIAETMLQRVQCINDRTATHEEDFDVNLTRLKVDLHSTFEEAGQSARHSLLSAAASDRVSYTTNDETTDVDPWRDAA
ncbi:MAG: hypothetical protein LQ346_004087 [Caloplaca aetnensis]|nr:MAG: hypothetical protein LQ346_004087 [Caloplaca aetnensis]